MFLGYPRSGHTLIGALLNAHPQMVIAHELDALGYVHAGLSRGALFALLLDRDRVHSESGSKWEGYEYHVPEQWQGRFERLRVIGDKKGGRSTMRLGAHPDLLAKLRRRIGVPLHVIHEVRNPFDNIATLFLKQHRPTLEACVQLYAQLLSTNRWAREQLGEGQMLTLRHEDFVADPRGVISRLCAFLGVQSTDDYLEACSKVVFESPRKTRHGVTWSAEIRREVEALIEQYDFLKGYTFESPAGEGPGATSKA